MNPFHSIATSICAICSTIVIAATVPAHSATQAPSAEAPSAEPAIRHAVTYCADRISPPDYFYGYRAASTHLNDDRTILCFDGPLKNDLGLSTFHQMQDQGILVIRSIGGYVPKAIAIADLLRAKAITVVVRDLCLSACANHILIASHKTYVLKNTVVAWHGGPADCRNPETLALTMRFQSYCSVDHIRFFATRQLSERHTIIPQTHYTRSRFAIVLQSAPNKRSVFWMWHPANHRDYFKGRIIYESYPDSQEAVDRILRPFWLYIRVIYDPPDELLAAR
jgi:hypothetical protein